MGVSASRNFRGVCSAKPCQPTPGLVSAWAVFRLAGQLELTGFLPLFGFSLLLNTARILGCKNKVVRIGLARVSYTAYQKLTCAHTLSLSNSDTWLTASIFLWPVPVHSL